MASLIEVLLRARNNLSPAVKAAVKDIEALGSAGQKSQGALGASLGRMSENLDRAGTSARSALSGISQLAGGGSTELGRLTGQAAQTADAIGDIGGAISKLGIAGIGLGAVSLILAEWGAVADRNARRIEASVKPYEEIAARLREIDSTTPLSNLATSLDTSTKNLDALIQSSRTAREEVLKWVEAEKELAALREREAIIRQAQQDTFGLLNRAAVEGLQLGDIKTFYDGLFTALQNGVGITGDFSSALQDLSAQQAALSATSKEARDEIAETNARLEEQNAALEANKARWDALNGVLLNYAANTSASALVTERWNQYNTKIANSLGETDRSLEKTGQSLDEYNAKWKKISDDGLRKGEAAISRIKSALMGLARSALAPTAVTEADMAAAALGNYVDKWDELARQADDVAITPANIAKYGELAKALDQTGLSAAEFARQFRDMSLFANPANLNLVNWDAFTQSIKDKIRAMIGEATLMKEAFREAVASLSPAELAAFTRALDLDPSAAGNVDKLFEAFSGEEADATKNTLGDMASKITVIEGTHTSTLNFAWETARTAIDAAHEYLQTKILQYADLLIEITARFTPPPATPPPPGGGAGNFEGRASGGYVGNGLYRLGEMGREYVLPHKMVKYIESVLGGPIRSPDEIGWLVSALEKGPQEAANQLQMWASGIAGWGVDAPEGAGKWIDKVYKRFERDYGGAALPASAQASAGGAGGGGLGSGDGMSEALPVLRDILATLRRIEKSVGGTSAITVNGNVDIKDLAKQVSREIGRGAFLRAALRT